MRLEVLGVPIDLGAARRGTDMGPSAIRYARLHEVLIGLGHQVTDAGNLSVPIPESRAEARLGLRYLPEVIAVCEALAAAVAATLARGAVPVILGGDHSLAIGTLAGLHRAGRAGGLIWLDAHGDFNTEETTPSGNIHGMPLAVAAGRGAPELIGVAGGPSLLPEAVVLVGVRSLDPAERAALHASGVTVFTMKEIDQQGIGPVMDRALDIASTGGHCGLHLSCDLDALDPACAPGVGTPVPGGLTYREAHLAMELIADSGLLGSVELVELNPVLDEHNRTADLGVELLASALGQRIY